MIKINSIYSKPELNRYYNYISSQNSRIHSTGTFVVNLLNKILEKQNESVRVKDFKTLLTMKFDELEYLHDAIDINSAISKAIINDEENSKKLNTFRNYYNRFFTTKPECSGNEIKKNNISLIQDLGITVCPYCNRNYINSRDDKSGCEFDHYYNKKNYPFFALSLYNLIPSCSTCNRIKTDESYDFCPFKVNSDEEVMFKVYPPSKSSKIQLYFGDKSQKNNVLKLEDAYEIHEKDVAEMFLKEEKYCKEYRDDLISLLGGRDNIGIDFSEEFFDCMIFGEIANDGFDDYLNHSLSKLKKDTYNYIVRLRVE
jgi:hypothetical protein